MKPSMMSPPGARHVRGPDLAKPKPADDFENPEKSSTGAPPSTATDSFSVRLQEALDELKKLRHEPYRALLVRDRGLALLGPCFEVAVAIQQDATVFDDIADALGVENTPNRKHYWTMPLNAICKPVTIAEQKRVSDLAYFLRAGLIEKVPPVDFVAWAEGKGITWCTDLVRGHSDDPTPVVDDRGPRDVVPPGGTKPPDHPNGDDPPSDAGVRIVLKMFETPTKQRSAFITKAAATSLGEFLDHHEHPDAADLIYAAANAIEGRPWTEMLDRLARQAGYVLAHDVAGATDVAPAATDGSTPITYQALAKADEPKD